MEVRPSSAADFPLPASRSEPQRKARYQLPNAYPSAGAAAVMPAPQIFDTECPPSTAGS